MKRGNGHSLHVILLVAQYLSIRKVALLQGYSPRTVTYWFRKFNEEGLAGLADAERSGRPRKLIQDQLYQIDTALRKSSSDYGILNILWDGKTLSALIKKKFKVEVGVRQCQRLFRQMGSRLRKPRPKMAGAHSDDRFEIWSINEVHFRQHGSRCCMWIPPETKNPLLLHHPTRKSVGYFGAVRLRGGKLLYP